MLATEAVMVDAVLTNKPMALARFSGRPSMAKVGTSPMAEPTPPMANTVDSPSVMAK